MKRQKRCKSCKELYRPDVRTYREQKVCNKPECQKWRKRENWNSYKLKNPDYVRIRKIKTKEPVQSRSEYMRLYRKSHPQYVETNRIQQKRRDAHKKGNLVTPTAINRIREDKLRRIAVLRNLVTPTACPPLIQAQLDVIVDYLRLLEHLVTPTAIESLY